jgi:hypothetical protein
MQNPRPWWDKQYNQCVFLVVIYSIAARGNIFTKDFAKFRLHFLPQFFPLVCKIPGRPWWDKQYTQCVFLVVIYSIAARGNIFTKDFTKFRLHFLPQFFPLEFKIPGRPWWDKQYTQCVFLVVIYSIAAHGKITKDFAKVRLHFLPQFLSLVYNIPLVR